MLLLQDQQDVNKLQAAYNNLKVFSLQANRLFSPPFYLLQIMFF